MLETNLFIQLSNLHDGWMEKPNSKLAGASYELKQNFILNLKLPIEISFRVILSSLRFAFA
jgi:hypothetical protein